MFDILYMPLQQNVKFNIQKNQAEEAWKCIQEVWENYPQLYFGLVSLLVSEGLDLFEAAGKGRNLLCTLPPWRGFTHRARLSKEV